MATVRQAIPAEVPPSSPSTTGELPAAARDGEPRSPDQRAPDQRTTGQRVIDQGLIDQRFEALLRHVQANRPSEDVSLIRKAWQFCVKHHEGQMRASGEPY